MKDKEVCGSPEPLRSEFCSNTLPNCTFSASTSVFETTKPICKMAGSGSMVLFVSNMVKRSGREVVKPKSFKLVEALVIIKDIGYLGGTTTCLEKTSKGEVREV